MILLQATVHDSLGWPATEPKSEDEKTKISPPIAYDREYDQLTKTEKGEGGIDLKNIVNLGFGLSAIKKFEGPFISDFFFLNHQTSD